MTLMAFGTDLWLAEGPVVIGAAGFRFPTRMAVIRLRDGSLFLWSPVAPVPELVAAVSALGRIAHLVAPNLLHDRFLADWKAVAPDAKIHTLPGLAASRPDLMVNAELSGRPDPAWAAELDQVLLRNRISDEVVFFHRSSGTVIFTDLLQGMTPGWFTGWRGLVARLDLMSGNEPAVPRKFRLGFRDRKGLRVALDTVLSWPVRQIVLAHGTPVTEGAREILTRAFGWVGRQ